MVRWTFYPNLISSKVLSESWTTCGPSEEAVIKNPVIMVSDGDGDDDID